MSRARVGLTVALLALTALPRARAEVTAEQVERAIRRGVAFLKSSQAPGGSWPGEPGVTALVSLALVTAGESPDSPAVQRAFQFLLQAPEGHHETYTLGLKAMAMASAPEKYAQALQAYATRLEQGQIRTPNRFAFGSWTYQAAQNGAGDNSNSQYALLGLHAASEAGARVDPVVFLRALRYWQNAQCRDGSWAYKAGQPNNGTGSMTCAGVSSLIIAGARLSESRERLVGNLIEHCGERSVDPGLQAGLDWLGRNFDVRGNINGGGQWAYYYLYGLERAGRLSGLRYFGRHDWYREGAEELVRLQNPVHGTWQGVGQEGNPLLATSFAVLFLAKGRSPVLINKLKHGPAGDWDNDHDDVANLTAMVSRDWRNLVTWQVVDPSHASVEDLLQAPIVYLNGHDAPLLSAESKRSLRRYIENGGLILAEACCSKSAFDRGFRELIREILPEPEYDLHPLPPEHPIWRSKYELDPNAHPLWGIEHGCRTVVIYSPEDLSCYWHHLEAQPGHPRVIRAARMGQNIIDYVTGRELPADKLAAREVDKVGVGIARRGALYIAKIKHGGDWNVAPLAIPNLTTTLRDKLKLDVVISHKEMTADDPNLVNFPLIYIHGRGAATFTDAQKAALRRHLTPGGGTLFADAACGSEAFDAAFRKLAADLFPDRPLEPIPATDDFFAHPAGFNLTDVTLNKAAGGLKGLPQLEGVKVDGHWAIIYSKYDLGCALERHAGIDCKGYTHESAVRIAANIVVYATMP
jgi:hypothetical protein